MTIEQTGQTSKLPDLAHDSLPVLWLCGAPGAGKSTVAWELFIKHANEQVAYVDIDQLKIFAPGSGESFALAIMNFGTLVDIHRELGTQALIVSGVIDPEQMSFLEAGISGRANVTWCLVDADDARLRCRIRERDWPEQLVDLVIAEARAWRGMRHIARVDTTSTTPAEAGKDVEGLIALRPATGPESCLRRGAMGSSDLVVIYGPRAVGKSTISWGLFENCVNRGEPTGYLDADQLGFIHADEVIRDRLICLAVVSIAQNFRKAGATCTIVNGNLSWNLIATLEDNQTMLVYLDASHEVLVERIAARNAGDYARLAGDDLSGASDETRAMVLEQAQRQREEYARAAASAHRINVTTTDTNAHVGALIGLLLGPRARP
ncbi:hypothetical protein [Devriesea agamarum]|uniref:hypothetical protein n=1 Tax=Devriesea agamarum TaxID=472569 RepID=UPI00071C94C5|nr:hypothetical protein [Devriesea agamarum]